LRPEQAAAKLRIQADRLREWERGAERPSIAQLRKLGELYKRPLAVFFLPEPPRDLRRSRHRRSGRDGTGMKTISIEDLRSRPRAATKELLAGRVEVLLTAEGKPVAMLVPVSSDTLGDTVRAVRLAGGQMALRAARRRARSMTMPEIDAVVAKARAARRRRARTTARL